MEKQTKTLLTVGALAAVGYLVWKQTQKPKAFANLMAAAPTELGGEEKPSCRGWNKRRGQFNAGGVDYFWCCDGNFTKEKPTKTCAELQTSID